MSVQSFIIIYPAVIFQSGPISHPTSLELVVWLKRRITSLHPSPQCSHDWVLTVIYPRQPPTSLLMESVTWCESSLVLTLLLSLIYLPLLFTWASLFPVATLCYPEIHYLPHHLCWPAQFSSEYELKPRGECSQETEISINVWWEIFNVFMSVVFKHSLLHICTISQTELLNLHFKIWVASLSPAHL